MLRSVLRHQRVRLSNGLRPVDYPAHVWSHIRHISTRGSLNEVTDALLQIPTNSDMIDTTTSAVMRLAYLLRAKGSSPRLPNTFEDTVVPVMLRALATKPPAHALHPPFSASVLASFAVTSLSPAACESVLFAVDEFLKTWPHPIPLPITAAIAEAFLRRQRVGDGVVSASLLALSTGLHSIPTTPDDALRMMNDVIPPQFITDHHGAAHAGSDSLTSTDTNTGRKPRPRAGGVPVMAPYHRLAEDAALAACGAALRASPATACVTLAAARGAGDDALSREAADQAALRAAQRRVLSGPAAYSPDRSVVAAARAAAPHLRRGIARVLTSQHAVTSDISFVSLWTAYVNLSVGVSGDVLAACGSTPADAANAVRLLCDRALLIGGIAAGEPWAAAIAEPLPFAERQRRIKAAVDAGWRGSRASAGAAGADAVADAPSSDAAVGGARGGALRRGWFRADYPWWASSELVRRAAPYAHVVGWGEMDGLGDTDAQLTAWCGVPVAPLVGPLARLVRALMRIVPLEVVGGRPAAPTAPAGAAAGGGPSAAPDGVYDRVGEEEDDDIDEAPRDRQEGMSRLAAARAAASPPKPPAGRPAPPPLSGSGDAAGDAPTRLTAAKADPAVLDAYFDGVRLLRGWLEQLAAVAAGATVAAGAPAPEWAARLGRYGQPLTRPTRHARLSGDDDVDSVGIRPVDATATATARWRALHSVRSVFAAHYGRLPLAAVSRAVPHLAAALLASANERSSPPTTADGGVDDAHHAPVAVRTRVAGAFALDGLAMPVPSSVALPLMVYQRMAAAHGGSSAALHDALVVALGGPRAAATSTPLQATAEADFIAAPTAAPAAASVATLALDADVSDPTTRTPPPLLQRRTLATPSAAAAQLVAPSGDARAYSMAATLTPPATAAEGAPLTDAAALSHDERVCAMLRKDARILAAGLHAATVGGLMDDTLRDVVAKVLLSEIPRAASFHHARPLAPSVLAGSAGTAPQRSLRASTTAYSAALSAAAEATSGHTRQPHAPQDSFAAAVTAAGAAAGAVDFSSPFALRGVVHFGRVLLLAMDASGGCGDAVSTEVHRAALHVSPSAGSADDGADDAPARAPARWSFGRASTSLVELAGGAHAHVVNASQYDAPPAATRAMLSPAVRRVTPADIGTDAAALRASQARAAGRPSGPAHALPDPTPSETIHRVAALAALLSPAHVTALTRSAQPPPNAGLRPMRVAFEAAAVVANVALLTAQAAAVAVAAMVAAQPRAVAAAEAMSPQSAAAAGRHARRRAAPRGDSEPPPLPPSASLAPSGAPWGARVTTVSLHSFASALDSLGAPPGSRTCARARADDLDDGPTDPGEDLAPLPSLPADTWDCAASPPPSVVDVSSLPIVCDAVRSRAVATMAEHGAAGDVAAAVVALSASRAVAAALAALASMWATAATAHASVQGVMLHLLADAAAKAAAASRTAAGVVHARATAGAAAAHPVAAALVGPTNDTASVWAHAAARAIRDVDLAPPTERGGGDAVAASAVAHGVPHASADAWWGSVTQPIPTHGYTWPHRAHPTAVRNGASRGYAHAVFAAESSGSRDANGGHAMLWPDVVTAAAALRALAANGAAIAAADGGSYGMLVREDLLSAVGIDPRAAWPLWEPEDLSQEAQTVGDWGNVSAADDSAGGADQRRDVIVVAAAAPRARYIGSNPPQWSARELQPSPAATVMPFAVRGFRVLVLTAPAV